MTTPVRIGCVKYLNTLPLIEGLEKNREIELVAAVRRYSELVGKTPPPITLRDTTTRWGSCSAAGALNFSWRLILAPSDVLIKVTFKPFYPHEKPRVLILQN